MNRIEWVGNINSACNPQFLTNFLPSPFFMHKLRPRQTTQLLTLTAKSLIMTEVADRAKICSLVADLLLPERREAALMELSHSREGVPDLAPLLWTSTSVMAVL